MSTPVRVLELRSVWGTGGGPDKTILAGAALADPVRFHTVVCYIRDARDTVFSIGARARDMGLDYEELVEKHSLDASVWPALRSLVRRRGVHIVHSHDHKTDLLAWALSACEDVIPVSTAHGFSGDTIRERVYYAVEKRLLARFPRVIAVSNPIKSELVRTGSRPDSIVVINNAIDPGVFKRDDRLGADARRRFGLPIEGLVVGAVGRLEPEKRFDLLLEAFARVRAAHRGVMLVIAGEGSLRGELEGLIGRLGLQDGCRLLGQCSDIVGLHHTLDLLVQSSEREGTPNAVLEAMAMETPIVATDVGGTGELVTDGEHGLLVPRHDVGRLAEALERAVADPGAAASRARSARQRVESQLSFERRVRRVEQIYGELIAQKPIIAPTVASPPATASRTARRFARSR